MRRACRSVCAAVCAWWRRLSRSFPNYKVICFVLGLVSLINSLTSGKNIAVELYLLSQ